MKTTTKVKCIKCQSDTVKNGISFGKQRYRCKNKLCQCNFRKSLPRPLSNEKQKRRCMIMYLAGFTVRDIQSTLEKIDEQTIRRWIKKYGSSLEPIVNKKECAFQEIKATYSLDKGETITELRTGLIFTEKHGKVIVSPLEKTPIFFHKWGIEAKYRK